MKFFYRLFLAGVLLSTSLCWADFGNWFVANQRLATVLDTSDKKISFRFTCQEDMTLTAAALYCMEATDPPAYLVSLQEDEKGLPSGVPLTSSSYIPKAQSWSALPLDSLTLLKGRVYHLVVEQDVKRGGGHPVGVIGPSHYASFLTTDFLNHRHPSDGSPDPASNTLYSEQGKWKELNQEPVYAVYSSGSKLQGNPYDDPGGCPIYGDPADKAHQVLQGQTLHFHCGFSATHFAIRVRKQGNPQGPLNYQVLKSDYRSHKNYPIFSAKALDAGQVSPEFKWVTVGFENKAYSNFSPECWYLVFQTDSGRPSKSPPGCEDCYVLSDLGNSGGLPNAASLTFDGGPHLSREVSSNDGGSPYNWLDHFERDANVGAIGPVCPSLDLMNFNPIPTPVPLDKSGAFEP